MTQAQPTSRLTKQDWLDRAVEILVADGIDRLRVQPLAQGLGVSRSSFYWHFESLEDLHGHMLDHWLDVNTAPILQMALRPADTLAEAVLNVFSCWVDEALFSPALDMAVRLWGRNDDKVCAVVAEADAQRLDALTRMFARYGMAQDDALVRARLLYFSQVGQYALGVEEPLDVRLSLTRAHLLALTGEAPDEALIAHFSDVVQAFEKAGS